MLEMLLNPRKAERKPWEMFFVGTFYSILSILLVHWLFSENPVFSEYSSILLITFMVMLSMPFVFFIFKIEEKRDYEKGIRKKLFGSHKKAVLSLTWLFIGFVFGLSLMFITFPSLVGHSMDAPLKQYCLINYPSQYDGCITKYEGQLNNKFEGFVINDHAIDVLTNNIYVLIFCLIFSILFGAGAVFVLAWNASIIATAIWIFSKSSIEKFPAAFGRYMIHGIPEIAAYFVAALSGGIIGISLIRYDIKDKRFLETLKDSINLMAIAIAILIVAALIEAYITPLLF